MALSSTYATPVNLGSAGSSSSGSFTQGAPLPNITTTQQQATAAPSFYTDYLNNLASQGANATQNAQYVGATPLQQQAFNQVSQNVGNYQPALSTATNLAEDVGQSNLSQALGNLNQQNIATNLAPQATAGIVGTGQFGSTRGVGALGQVISNADIATQAQQAQAMQQDYANQLAASQQLGNLATTTQSLGLGDINALSTLGGQQQTIAQNQQLFPMQQLTNESALLRGYSIPTSTSSTYTGPIPGAYQASPLQQIAGLGALVAGASNTNLGQQLFGTQGQPGLLSQGATGISDWFSNLTGSNSSSSSSFNNSIPSADNSGAMPTTETGTPDTTAYDSSGNAIGTYDSNGNYSPYASN